MNVVGPISRSCSRCVIVIALVCAALSSVAQERAKPIQQQELWASIGFKGRLPGFTKGLFGKETYKKIRFAGEVGYRSADTFFSGRQVYTDIGLRYKISKIFSVTGEYRTGFRANDVNRHRLGLSLSAGTSWKRFELGYGANYQHNFLPIGEQREIIRNKFSVEYNIRKFKLDPEVSAEFFTWIGYQGAKYIGTRYSIGTSYSPSKTHKIGFKMVHDREYGVAWPTYRWIYSLSYTLNLRDL